MSEHTTLPKADLGEASHIEVVEQLLQVDGQYLVDVGSGDGGFACALAERGANVLAIEPDERRTPPELHSAIRDRVTFKLAGGEAIPLEDGESERRLLQPVSPPRTSGTHGSSSLGGATCPDPPTSASCMWWNPTCRGLGPNF